MQVDVKPFSPDVLESQGEGCTRVALGLGLTCPE